MTSHHYWQQAFSGGLQSPRQSNYTITCYPWVQTIYCITDHSCYTMKRERSQSVSDLQYNEE